MDILCLQAMVMWDACRDELGGALRCMQVRRPGEMLEFEVWDGRLIRQFQVL